MSARIGGHLRAQEQINSARTGGAQRKDEMKPMQKKGLALFLCAILALAALLSGCAHTPAATPAPTQDPTAAPSPEATAEATAEATEAPEATPEADATEAPSAEAISIVDVLGNEVTLDAYPEKIVSLSPSTTEILYALGLGDKLVGRDSYSDYPAESADVPVVGDYSGPNVEAIAATEADLVLASTTLQQDAIDQLKSLGITVASVEATTYEQIAETITMIGTLTGAQEEAAALNASMTEAADAVAAAVADLEKPTVYYVMSYGEYGNWTSGPGSFINSIIELAGGAPVTADAEAPWLEYSLEQLLQDDPDVILVSSDAGDPALLADAEGYKDLTAVKEGRAYSIDANTSSRPGPRILEAAEAVAALLHPDAFPAE